jgi:hypothetical protein
MTEKTIQETGASYGERVALRLRDGTTARFYEDDVFPGCFLHETERWRRSYDGEEPGPAHPFVEAMRNAAEGEVERLVPTHGTMILTFLGEDEIMRGERERPGPRVRETSPGVYESGVYE